MTLSEIITQAILPFIARYGILISFFGGFITGESVILILAFMSATGILPVWYLLVFCTLGMFCSDFVPFTMGRHRWFVNFLWSEKTKHRGNNIEKILHKYTKHNLFLILLMTKFTYGASIPALFYLGSKKTPYTKFAATNIFVNIIFVPSVILVGWLAGKGFKFATNIFADIRIALLLVILIIVLFVIGRKWLDLRLIKKQRL